MVGAKGRLSSQRLRLERGQTPMEMARQLAAEALPGESLVANR
jgi:hypothetical protein